MKDMKKKLTVLSLVLALVLGMFFLTGCSLFEDEDDDEDDVKTEQREEKDDDDEDEDDDEKDSKKSSKDDDEDDEDKDEDEEDDDDEKDSKKSSKYDDDEEDEDEDEDDDEDRDDDDEDSDFESILGDSFGEDFDVVEEDNKVIVKYSSTVSAVFYHNKKDVTKFEVRIDCQSESKAKELYDSYKKSGAYDDSEEIKSFEQDGKYLVMEYDMDAFGSEVTYEDLQDFVKASKKKN